MNIVQRLVLIVLLAAIPVGVLHGLAVRSEHREEREEVSLVALRTANRAAAEQRRIVAGARQLLSALAQMPAVRSREAGRCGLILRRLQAEFPIYTAIGVADSRGLIWCSSSRPGTNVSDRAYFREAITTRQFTTGGYIIGRVMRRRTLNFSLPILDSSGQVSGLIIAGLDLDRLAKELSETAMPPAGRLAIIGPDRRVLVDLPDGATVGMLLPERFRTAFAAKQAGTFRGKWLDGSDRLIAFVPPAAHRGMPFLITVGIEHDQALADVENTAFQATMVLLLVVLAALLIAWWFATRYVRHPVLRLAGTVRAWREGDAEARVGRLDPGSEFDDLGQAFDAMADTMAERERRLRDALESTTDSVVALTTDWTIGFMNERSRARLKDADIIGRNFWDVFSDLDPEAGAALRQAMIDRSPTTVTFDYAELGGRFETNAYPSAEGGLTLFSRDVTEEHRARETLQHLALHDPLTGLPNRAHLMETARRAASNHRLTAMVLLDLDGFKHVNDSHGHHAGDEMLRAVARRLTACLGSVGTIGRLGGDEFVALLFATSELRSVEIGNALLECLEREPFLVHTRLHHITSSCGLVLVDPGSSAGVEDLLANADLALYRAKAAGGGICRTYDIADRHAYDARRVLEEEVSRAATMGQFELHYQPQVGLADGRVVGAEALLRWRHPERGLLPPHAFIDVLEESRHARRVGAWIVDEACRQAALWQRMGMPMRVGINVFPEQVRSGELADVVQCALATHGLPAEAVEIEITENIALSADEDVRGALLTLRTLGVRLAFDDFGTGFASLTTLKDFPVDRLKIDRGFVAGLPSNAHDRAIVEAVLALARTLDMQVIAEGVETREHEEYLWSRGCLEGQGFLYAKPMPAADFRAYVRASRAQKAS